MTIEDLQYPVGRFTLTVGPDGRRAAIDDITALPTRLREAAGGLHGTQLDTPYRPGGWTVRQLVHHVADSHMNAFIRTKLALTESSPTIKPYDQDAFATLPDMRLPIEISLAVIDGVHARWVTLWRSMSEEQFALTFVHPEQGRAIPLDEVARHYGWHSRHHVAHITGLRQRQQW